MSKAGARAVRVEDVARRAGVALSTASRVLTGHPSVRASTRARVLEAASELGYRPNHAARSLRTGRTFAFGYVTNMLTASVLEAITGAEQSARKYGYVLMLASSELDSELEQDHLRVFLDGRVDGLILQTVADPDDTVWQQVEAARVPIVLLDRDIALARPVSSVAADHTAGSRDATRHLLSLGHRAIGLISEATHVRPIRQRMDGVREAYQQASLAHDDAWIRLGPLEVGFGRAAACDLLTAAIPVTALMVASPSLLPAVLDGIRDAGLELGRDVAMVAFDDSELARAFRPRISVVAGDASQMGAIAARMLAERIKHPGSPLRSMVLPTRYIARESSSAAPRKLESPVT